MHHTHTAAAAAGVTECGVDIWVMSPATALHVYQLGRAADVNTLTGARRPAIRPMGAVAPS